MFLLGRSTPITHKDSQHATCPTPARLALLHIGWINVWFLKIQSTSTQVQKPQHRCQMTLVSLNVTLNNISCTWRSHGNSNRRRAAISSSHRTSITDKDVPLPVKVKQSDLQNMLKLTAVVALELEYYVNANSWWVCMQLDLSCRAVSSLGHNIHQTQLWPSLFNRLKTHIRKDNPKLRYQMFCSNAADVNVTALIVPIQTVCGIFQQVLVHFKGQHMIVMTATNKQTCSQSFGTKYTDVLYVTYKYPNSLGCILFKPHLTGICWNEMAVNGIIKLQWSQQAQAITDQWRMTL